MTTKAGESPSTDRKEPEAGDYSDPRIRWPDPKWRETERPAGEWPDSRATGQDPADGSDSAEPPEPLSVDRIDQESERDRADARNGSDDRIRKEITEDLNADPECDTTKIAVEVRDGTVVLEGRVPTRPMKHRAAEIANAARDVRTVDNRLQVV